MAKDQQPAVEAPKKPLARRRVRKSDAEEVLGVKFLSRFDPDEDFSDVDGDPQNEFGLREEESDRHYHWARNTPDDIGLYKGGVVPYRVEYAEKDGVRPAMSSEIPIGEPIAKRDLVLVSCDKGLWQKRNRFERSRQVKTNERMFRRRQRDTDFSHGDRAQMRAQIEAEQEEMGA
jgi:hypothetical protein